MHIGVVRSTFLIVACIIVGLYLSAVDICLV